MMTSRENTLRLFDNNTPERVGVRDTPEHIDFRMTSREVWDRDYRPKLTSIERERIDVDRARQSLAEGRQRQKWTHYGSLFIWEQMRRSMGDVCMYESLVLDPDWIHDYCRV